LSIFSYQLSRGQTRWQFTIDLPPAADGRRRQMNRKGFLRQEDALAAETEARKTYARADLAADGSLAAELELWLGERELDVQETTLGNYRDIVRCYVLPHLGSRQVYMLNKRAIHDLYKTLLTRGSKRGGPLSRTTVGNVHRVLMKALSDLNVDIDGIRKPRPEQRETAGRKGVWTAEQAGRFLAHPRRSPVVCGVGACHRRWTTPRRAARAQVGPGGPGRRCPAGVLAAHHHLPQRRHREGTQGQEQAHGGYRTCRGGRAA
jgi:hypothetical protein